MNLIEIITAVRNGKTVHWSNESYQVIESKNDFLIKHISGSCIGLTWADNITMNGREEEFYIPNNA